MKDLTTSKNPLSSKSFNLSVQIVNICKILRARKTDSAIINQLIKSGTSIGANVMEANNSESPKDFIHKLTIAQKEAAETHYWLKLLLETKYLSIQEY
jgi:four helix bundle protein